MINSDDLIDGLTKIGAYDYQFPRPSKIVVEAWLEHFEQYPALTRDDLLDAIKVYYRKPEASPPKPADVSHLARELRRDRNSRWTDEDMGRFEALCDSKAAPDEHEESFVAIAATEVATEDARRRAIEAFASSRTNIAFAATGPNQTVKELVDRQRAAAPPQPIVEEQLLPPGFNAGESGSDS